MSNPGLIDVFENLFMDWTLWLYEDVVNNVTGKYSNAWCMAFHVKDPNKCPPLPATGANLGARLYSDFPTNPSALHFTIYFKLINGTKLEHATPKYSITGVEYMDGKRIDWNEEFTGCEMDDELSNNSAISMEHFVKMYKPLSNPIPLEIMRWRHYCNTSSYAFVPDIATDVFNQHQEQIERERVKKYNACFYTKVKLCLPDSLPKEVVLAVAKYGFLTA